jgi:cardiolipin synthase
LNKVRWIQSGSAYFDELCELIASSEYEIHIQTYIFSSDHTGLKVAEALMDAAKRGVKVFLLIDAYGSKQLSETMEEQMAQTGIRIFRYGRLYSQGRFHISRRLHRKIIVIDGKTAIIGGMNISDHYNDIRGEKAWLDFAVIIEGDIPRKLRHICKARWKGYSFPKLNDNDPEPKGSEYSIPVRIRRNDFVRNQNEIAVSYRQAIRQATKSLLFIGAYFLPGGRSRRLIRDTARRGVEIRVLVAERSDVGIMVNARRYLYAWLIRNGIRVFEYRKSNVHGKVLIADQQWLTIGSFDLNNLSTFSNIELNVDINHKHFSNDLSNHILNIMEEDCIEITKDLIEQHSGIFEKFKLWCSYQIVKTLFVLSVYLSGKKGGEY